MNNKYLTPETEWYGLYNKQLGEFPTPFWFLNFEDVKRFRFDYWNADTEYELSNLYIPYEYPTINEFIKDTGVLNKTDQFHFTMHYYSVKYKYIENGQFNSPMFIFAYQNHRIQNYLNQIKSGILYQEPSD